MTHIRVLSVALLLVACKKQPPVAAAEDIAEPVAARTAPATAGRASSEQIAALRQNFSRVYFDTDSAQINAQSKEALDANAAILVGLPRLSVEIQGHADERGTTDYNLALGQKRAENIRRYLVSQGVSRDRIAIVSYGEERPIDASHTEVAWSQNRRAEFRLTRDDDGVVQGTTE